MTEKRYEFVDLGETWAVSVDGECKYYMHRVTDCKEVVELLNENEQLKKDLKLIKELKNCDVNEMLELQEENEQLQKRIQELEISENEIILKQETTINQLIKKNERLNEEIKQYKALIVKKWSSYVEKEMNK